MADIETFAPTKENRGKDCVFWSGGKLRCGLPKLEVESAPPYGLCKGTIGEMCIKLDPQLYRIHILGRLPETPKPSGEMRPMRQRQPTRNDELPPAS